MSTQSLDITMVSAVTPGVSARGDSSRDFAFPISSQPVAASPPLKSSGTTEAAQPAQPPSTAATNEARMKSVVEELNKLSSNMHTDLKFSVEEDLGVIVVAVIDARDGKVLRQMPSEEALRIARDIESYRSGLIEAVA